MGTLVIPIGDPVAIAVYDAHGPRAAVALDWTWFVRAIIFAVAYSISVGIWTTVGGR
jgi:hypothetical protein